MRKLLTLVVLAIASTTASAQLTDGSIAPDFTYNDLSGNPHHLYQETGNGKTVYIMAFWAWNTQCWNYHNTGNLQTFYNQHGPSGTIDTTCEIFMIEDDGGSSTAALNGANSFSGDWVTTSPYPIMDLDAANTNSFDNTMYSIVAHPQIYKVCPNNRIYSMGLPNGSQLLASLGSCPYSLDAAPNGTPPIICTATYGPQFGLKNNCISSALTTCDVTYAIDGGSPTVYNWAGNLGAGLTTTVTLPSQVFTAGTHTMDLTTSSPNGGVDNNIYNDNATYTFAIVPSATLAPYTQDFSSAGFPYPNWEVNNPDADVTWSYAAAGGGSMFYDTYNYPVIGEVDEAVVEKLDLSSVMTAALHFDVAHCEYSTVTSDALAVLISTNCGASWVQLWTKSGSTLATVPVNINAFVPSTAADWRTETINLAAYVGQPNVLIKFVATDGYGNGIYIDNIDISSTTDVQNADLMTNCTLFPNPANEKVNVTFDLPHAGSVMINVYNTMGALVASTNNGIMNAGTETVVLATDNLESGMYIVEVRSGASSTRSTMVISH